MKKYWLFVPLVLLMAGAFFLFSQLNDRQHLSPSEDWRGKPFPEFHSADLLTHQPLTKTDFPAQPLLVNVWASWCSWCVKEFPLLLALKQQGVIIVGITYLDQPDEACQALQRWGNPFATIIVDNTHLLTQTLNINTAPTSYLVDKKGIVRYQFKGYDANLVDKILPLWQQLEAEK